MRCSWGRCAREQLDRADSRRRALATSDQGPGEPGARALDVDLAEPTNREIEAGSRAIQSRGMVSTRNVCGVTAPQVRLVPRRKRSRSWGIVGYQELQTVAGPVPRGARFHDDATSKPLSSREATRRAATLRKAFEGDCEPAGTRPVGQEVRVEASVRADVQAQVALTWEVGVTQEIPGSEKKYALALCPFREVHVHPVRSSAAVRTCGFSRPARSRSRSR